MRRAARVGALLALAIGLARAPDPARANPEIPGAAQSAPILLEQATIHPVNGPPIADGMLLFDQGRIVAIGQDIAVPENAQRVSLRGQHVYPGMIESYSHIGLTEIDSVRATRDSVETGWLNPNVKAHVAVNPDSELIPVTRSNGVLLALAAPSGGGISGQSAVLQLDGWTYEDLTLKAGVGMHVRWPHSEPVLGGESDGGRDGAWSVESLAAALRDTRAYQQARAAGGSLVDARWESLIPVVNRGMPLIVAADEAQQIQSAVAFARRERLRIILYGGYDAPDCADLLRADAIPVIVAGVYRLPQRTDDPFDASYTLPERLRQAGIAFCISSAERFGGANARNLPYHAATALAYGLPADEALKSITLYPARILGVADRVGSLEPGKDATLFITNGDPLETATQVRAAYIQGRKVDLNDRHKRLYKKYSEKLRRVQP